MGAGALALRYGVRRENRHIWQISPRFGASSIFGGIDTVSAGAPFSPLMHYISDGVPDERSAGDALRLCSFERVPNSPPSFFARTLFKMLNGVFFCNKFLYESYFRKIILIYFSKK